MRAGVARHRLQSIVVGAVALLSAGTAVLGLGLLVVSDAPFDHAFAAQSGAHVAAQFDPARTGTATLAATAHASGVRATAGPFETVGAAISSGRVHRADTITVVGRQDQREAVDQLTLDSGRWLTGAGQVVLSRNQWGPIARLGATVTLRAGDSSVELRVVGFAFSVTGSADAWVWPTQSDILHPRAATATPQSGSSPDGEPQTGTPHTGLQMLYRFDSAGNAAAITASLAIATRTLPANALLGSLSYLSVKQAADRGTAPMIPFVLAFAVLGLVMAALVVGNVVSGAVIAGYTSIGIRKTLGFTPRQVVVVYAGQMLLPGIVGSLCGVLLGNVLSLPLLAQASRAYNVSGQSSIPLWVDLVALAGVVAILAVAAVIPAVRAGALPATQAISMGRAPRAGHGYRIRRWLSATGLPRPVSFGLATPLSRPGRATGTVVAILLGAVTVVFALGLGSSLGRVAQALDRTDAVPVAVRIPPSDPIHPAVDLDTLESALKAQPRTARYVATGELDATLVGASDQIRITWYRGDATWVGLEMITGRWYRGAGEAIASSGLLRTTGHHVGDTVTLTADGGSRKLTIVGEYLGGQGEGLVADASALTGLSTRAGPSEYDIALVPGTSIDAYIQALTAADPEAHAENRVVEDGEDNFAIILGLIGTLTLVLTLVAALGVFNTVVLNTRERVHEIGILKTLGMTPRQVRAMVVASMVGLGVVGGAIALPLGVFLHARIVPVMADAANTDLPASVTDVYDGATLALLGCAGIVIAVLGALVPAGWAARSRIVTALRAE
jgi:putative ABC transport system permease protein